MARRDRENKSKRFVTGSRFFGRVNEMGMQGYGSYAFPDGTRYLGETLNGRFHGLGTIIMAKPYSISFTVLHHEGKLQQILQMLFSDSLSVDFEMPNDDEMSFAKWKYCSEEDRRFHREKLQPMQAVGPSKFQTKDGPEPPPLGRNIFDLGFGMFNRLGCMNGMAEHMTNTRDFYVGCADVRHWIRANCRHGPFVGDQLEPEIVAQSARQIIRNNVESEKKLSGHALQLDKLCRSADSQATFSSGQELRLHLANDTTDSTS
ncbi:hypothetical protein KR222_002593, partial [Zaprionus bogoriensis]